MKRGRILEAINKNPRLILLEIIDIVDVELGHSIVDKILCDHDFCLKIPRNYNLLEYKESSYENF